MRASREVKARHHKEIVISASKMLRESGIDRTSVMDLMRAAGLTNGGFYRHFKSKNELVAESTRSIYGDIIEKLARTDKKSARAALSAYVDEYLSSHHINAPEKGCPLAAYGAEAARENKAVHEAFDQGLDQLLSLMAEGMPGPKEHRRADAAQLLSLMTGAVIMARAAGNSKLSREILNSARQQAARMIGEKR